MDVDGLAGADDGAGGLDGDAHLDVLPRADTPEHAARIVVAKAPWSKRIPVRGTTLRHTAKTGANLHALDGVEAHHGVGNIGVKLVVQGLAQAHGHAGGLHADAGPA